MKQLPRVLMFLSAISLLSLFVFPMWRVTLLAPQYPEGVNMLIWINKIGGDKPSTLQNINILNHYIGMKKIEPDSIPELTYFPYIVMVLAGMAALFAIINKRWLFLGWAILVTILAILGIYDFYLWEYDYGHSLSADAPMKFPGASFQPPLIGSKAIINFTAISLPSLGGYLAGLSIILSYVAWWIKTKFNSNEEVTPSPIVSLAGN